ncbi:MAG: L,D-transpeptidase [Chloroflexi bacterium]|nr:L,D-transpeptidase [Chloroflexota bacterium]
MKSDFPSRRDFLKLAGLGVGALALNPFRNAPNLPVRLPSFPAADRLGRVAVAPNFYSTPLMSQPNENSSKIRDVAQDEVVVWHREVIGSNVSGRTNMRWVETPDGFIYAVDLQPVRNLPNTPIASVPSGKSGFWAEVTVPYVDLQLQNTPISPAIQFLVQYSQPIRLYYGQVIWIDQVAADSNGSMFYRVNEAPGRGYGYGDLFFADGAGFKVLTDDDVSPIHPDVDPATKKIVVDATPTRQYLSCLEGETEVYFCRISSGYGEKFSTPTGDQAVARKIFSIHMAANTGSDSGYDTMGVPWPVFFNLNVGAAVHGVFWHNDFGVRRSHGCINALPEDAKWIYRWTTPFVSLDQSEAQLQWPNVGGSFSTAVKVNETTVPV